MNSRTSPISLVDDGDAADPPYEPFDESAVDRSVIDRFVRMGIAASSQFQRRRRALARLDIEQRANMCVPPEDSLLGEILRIFETVTEVESATPDDSIASLGGDSLREIILLVELDRRYNISMPADLVARRPTIRQVADWIRSITVQRTLTLSGVT